MRPRSLTRRASAVAVAATSAALILTGCGDDPDDSGSGNAADESRPTVEVDDELAARVPDEIGEDGKITVGTDSSYAPSEFLDEDGETIVGFDIDLFSAVAEKIGFEAEFESADFGTIITGVGSGRYEVGVSSFTINPDRLAEATMISYFSAGTQWATKAGNPENVDPGDACGLSVAVQADTVQVDDITARSAACEAAGEEPIDIQQFEGQDEATAAIVSGRVDAGLADSPVMAYAVQQTNEQLELLGDIYDSAPYGWVVPLEETEFGQVLADALTALIEDGTYAEILEKWGVEAGAIDSPEVNPAG
ncbi:amino acid ABC transporter substrate-binding protein, PAAT family (TC 3.A.1.3.-) [Blastococcus aurantiacus]|uniref:Amino acid ABC transporter substrate-binding protein, PAAT family (TC 3.A.1.3.-) n=1 Tax=Blastococcus aurantiacus TaxID=1550231 RepID=A0A1G7NJN2_9ACTN|nr:ABC transporter substrate-binding protein [Blastococcus aurantiacus]SDF74258.1 amino acid ABC transporter substrate-binding protein, PAAT family (TC 3.A.1.3.-) [Blastococcus aurantiacus]